MYLEVFKEIFIFTYYAAYYYTVHNIVCLPRLCIMILWSNYSETVNNPFRSGKMRCTLKEYFRFVIVFYLQLKLCLVF